MENNSSVTPAEPQINVNNTEAAKPRTKKSHGLVLGLILCLILAAGGIGFGVFEMMESNNKETRISDYKNEVASLNSKINTLTDEIEELNTKTGSGVEEDYIYVTELGVKIKKPSDAQDLIDSYAFYNGHPMAIDTFEITGRGATSRTIMFGFSGQEDVESCEESLSDNGVCFELGDKIYMAMEGAGNLAPGEKLAEPDEFVKFFLDPENYSEI